MKFTSRKSFAFGLLLLTVSAPSMVSAQGLTSLPRLRGLKFPNSASEGTRPVETFAKPFSLPESRSGFNDLLPFVLRSPDQEDAGTCLYMSLTGIAEFWLAKLHPSRSREPDGPIDLSERYMINLGGTNESQIEVKNWLTDSIYVWNKKQQAILNKDYRFTKGWYKSGSNGNVLAKPNEAGAQYGTSVNWVNQLSTISAKPVELPKFERTVLFEDPERNQWNVGVAPADIVEKVKTALVAKKAPVQVIYNHYGYWHSVFIVGFDDTQNNDHCSFVEGFLKYMQKNVDDLVAQEHASGDSAERQRIHARMEKARLAHDKASDSYKAAGACHDKGVFYVRDSIYEDDSGPMYDFDPSQTGEETHFTKSLVVHEYEWLQHMANNVIQISAK